MRTIERLLGAAPGLALAIDGVRNGRACTSARDRPRRHRRRGHERERPRGRRLGDRGDRGLRHAFREDRRHRRSRPLRRARICRPPTINSGCAVTALRTRRKSPAPPGLREPHRNGRAERRRRGAGIPGSVLVLDDEGAATQRGREPAGRRQSILGVDQEPLVHRLSSDRPARDAHGPAPVRPFRERSGSVGAAHPIRPGGPADARVGAEPARRRAAEVFRRLDRPDRGRRAAACEARPPERCRAQHRRDRARLVDRQGLHARLERHGSAQSDRQRLRAAVRRTGALHGRVPDPRPEDEHRDVPSRAGAGSGNADHEEHAAAATVARIGAREAIWDSKANAHNPMLDEHGRVWYTAVVRAPDNAPAYCREGSDHPSAKHSRCRARAGSCRSTIRRRKKYTFIDTCYSTHHLQFAEDANDTLWTSGGGPVVGWLEHARCSTRPAMRRARKAGPR